MTAERPDLHSYLEASAAAAPESIAVEELGEVRIDYASLDALSDRVRDRLVALGVGPGDRVGMCLPKTIDAVAVIFCVLQHRIVYGR